MTKFKFYCLAMAFLFSILIDSAQAENDNNTPQKITWDSIKDQASKTWASDKYEFYVPLHTWHNRLLYDKNKYKKYNENPWGAGFGKYRYDENGNWHAIMLWPLKTHIINGSLLPGMVINGCGSLAA